MTRDSEERRNGEDAQRLSAPARPNGAEGNRPDSIAHKQLIERLEAENLAFRARDRGWALQSEEQQETIATLITERDELRETLKAIISGDVPRPIGTQWRADGQASKNDRCTHDLAMYDDCGQCTAEFADAALHNTTNQREEAQS